MFGIIKTEEPRCKALLGSPYRDKFLFAVTLEKKLELNSSIPELELSWLLLVCISFLNQQQQFDDYPGNQLHFCTLGWSMHHPEHNPR